MHTINRASLDEAPAAVLILRHVSMLLAEEGAALWDPWSFHVDNFCEAATRGEVVLGYEDSEPVACMLLQRSDPLFWPNDPPGEALYLHKVAVLPGARGCGWSGRFIQWAYTEALESGARFLRLDTAPRSKLVALYEQHGFVLVDREPRVFGTTRAVRLELPLRGDVLGAKADADEVGGDAPEERDRSEKP